MPAAKYKDRKYIKRCDCEGSLGGDGWATEKWLGDYVCKKCKELDELRAYETSKENLDLMNK